jgi:hypothetical protein
LKGQEYLSEKNIQYTWTNFTVYFEDNEWIGQDGKKYDITIDSNTAKRILFIRISNFDETNKLKGDAVFVFYDNREKDKYNSIHKIRLVHTLRKEINDFFEKKYRNDSFRNWVEEKNKTMYAITLKHGIGTQDNAVQYYLQEENVNIEYLKTTITFLLNKIHLAGTVSTLSVLDLKEFRVIDILNEMEQKWLKILCFHHDKFDSFNDNEDEVKKFVKIDYSSINDEEKQTRFLSSEMIINEFVFELLYNIRKHILYDYYDEIKGKNKKVKITISYKDSCLVFSNNFCDLISLPSYNSRNKNDGLNLINNVLENLQIGKLKVDFENSLFNVYIPLKKIQT